MKLIIETQNAFRLRLNKNEFEQLKKVAYLDYEYCVMGRTRIKLRVDSSKGLGQRLLNWKYVEEANTHEIVLGPKAVEHLHVPSKKGIVESFDTALGTFQIGIEIDLKNKEK